MPLKAAAWPLPGAGRAVRLLPWNGPDQWNRPCCEGYCEHYSEPPPFFCVKCLRRSQQPQWNRSYCVGCGGRPLKSWWEFGGSMEVCVSCDRTGIDDALSCERVPEKLAREVEGFRAERVERYERLRVRHEARSRIVEQLRDQSREYGHRWALETARFEDMNDLAAWILRQRPWFSRVQTKRLDRLHWNVRAPISDGDSFVEGVLSVWREIKDEPSSLEPFTAPASPAPVPVRSRQSKLQPV
jgi:hypothetical protein